MIWNQEAIKIHKHFHWKPRKQEKNFDLIPNKENMKFHLTLFPKGFRREFINVIEILDFYIFFFVFPSWIKISVLHWEKTLVASCVLWVMNTESICYFDTLAIRIDAWSCNEMDEKGFDFCEVMSLTSFTANTVAQIKCL